MISPTEVFVAYVIAQMTAAGNLPAGGVLASRATDAEQQAGCVVITEAGQQDQWMYGPVYQPRMQIRTIHQRDERAETIGYNVKSAVHQQGRLAVGPITDGHTYLVHQCNVIAGPSRHYDSQETFEYLLYASVWIDTRVIS